MIGVDAVGAEAAGSEPPSATSTKRRKVQPGASRSGKLWARAETSCNRLMWNSSPSRRPTASHHARGGCRRRRRTAWRGWRGAAPGAPGDLDGDVDTGLTDLEGAPGTRPEPARPLLAPEVPPGLDRSGDGSPGRHRHRRPAEGAIIAERERRLADGRDRPQRLGSAPAGAPTAQPTSEADRAHAEDDAVAEPNARASRIASAITAASRQTAASDDNFRSRSAANSSTVRSPNREWSKTRSPISSGSLPGQPR